MTPIPPTPAQKAYRRVLRISWFDGWSLCVIAGLSLMLTLVLGELLGIAISLLILAAGVMELRGRRLLQQREVAGIKLLVRSQLFLLTVILVYCARCLGSFDEGYLTDQLLPDMRQSCLLLGINLDEMLQQLEITPKELVPLVHTAFILLYGTVALVSVLYQGGLAVYYRSKTRLIAEAITAPIVVSAPVPPS